MEGENLLEGALRQPQQNQLTVDLLKNFPEEYKSKLIQLLAEKTEWGMSIWEKQVSRGVASVQSISFNPNSWVSKTELGEDGKRVYRIGVQQIPAEVLPKFMFESDKFTEDEIILYRFSHELCHDVGYFAAKASGDFARLYNLALEMRKKSQRGFARLASWDFYKQQGAEIQATEDVVELLNIFSIKGDYLNSYFDYLQDPNNFEEKNKLGIQHVSSDQVRDALIKQIKAGMAAYLK